MTMLPGTFYAKDPRLDPEVICTAYTKAPIQPGGCETVTCTWTNPPPLAVNLVPAPTMTVREESLRRSAKT